jgi:hypothetical protein
MENYEYLKKRVVEMSLEITKHALDEKFEDVAILRELMTYYIGKMMELKSKK